MEEGEKETTDAVALAEERLRLEREALAVERERLAAARTRAEAEERMERSRRHPALAAVAVALLAMLCFAGGVIAGMAVADGRQQKLREERLAKALSQLGDLADVTSPTNSAAGRLGARTPDGAHRNVAVMVIQ
ncbi:MAG: hypothetical protein IKL96_11815 [Kiritimatiellae bacterium]|nr:hypothetical protein [Kiritimatiellia bacterium]